MSTALIVVDMQNAFVAPNGSLAVDGADRVLAAVNQWVAHTADHGWPVFYTRDIDPSGRGGPDTELHPDLDVRGTVVDKGPGAAGGFSGFVLSPPDGPPGGDSTLAGLLRDTGVDRVVVVGLAADVCVAATARDARRLGYDVDVDLRATAFVHAHPGGDEAALADLRAAGVRLTEQVPT